MTMLEPGVVCIQSGAMRHYRVYRGDDWIGDVYPSSGGGWFADSTGNGAVGVVTLATRREAIAELVARVEAVEAART